MARYGFPGCGGTDGLPAGPSEQATRRPNGPVSLPGLGRSQEPPYAAPVPQGPPHRPTPHPEAAGLKQLVFPGAVCLDVGPGCSRCTAALTVLAGPGGQVHRLAAPGHAGGVATVDRFCRQADLTRVDFISVEFGEDELVLLLGAFGTLLRDRPTLLLRWGRPCSDRRRTAEAVRGLTVSLSYTMHGWQEGDWRPVPDAMPGWGSFLFRPSPVPGRIQ